MMTFSLRGDDSIATDGSGRVLLTAIGFSRDSSLICESDQASNKATSDWYINPVSQSTALEDRIVNTESQGWTRNRNSTNGILLIRRRVENPLEGVLTCKIEEDPMSPISVGVYYSS